MTDEKREAKNVDDLIVKSMNTQANNNAVPPVIPEPPKEEKAPEVKAENIDENVPHGTPKEQKDVKQDENAKNINETDDKKSEEPKDSPIDEYGNPIEKPKMYTEDELNSIIRDRIRNRRQDNNQPTQQQIQQETKDFKADPNSEESWEVQLEKFIETTIDKRQRKQSEQQWREQENQKQADFESRFNNGMSKYQDFERVTSGKSITRDMLMATRGLENPAAFVYGASKMHPQELDRISKIGDPYIQAVEVGRLHEKMVKERRMVSGAPKPLEAPKGDIISNKSTNPVNIDHRINEYAKQKRR